MEKFLHSNDPKFRLLRTIVQGMFGVLIANLDILVSAFKIDGEAKSVIVAACMAILSPIMASIGSSETVDEESEE